MAQKITCTKCDYSIEDAHKSDVDLVEKWVADGYAPCPIIQCQGELRVIECVLANTG